MIPGDGNMKTCWVDNLDIGRFITKVIVDDRTLNKKVMAHGEALSMNEVYDIVEEMTGEKPERKYVSHSRPYARTLESRWVTRNGQWSSEQLDASIKQLQAMTQGPNVDYMTLVGKFWLEYYYSSFIDGDNSPEGVERLGFLWAKDLYPNLKPTTFRDFFQDIMDGKRTLPYSSKK